MLPGDAAIYRRDNDSSVGFNMTATVEIYGRVASAPKSKIKMFRISGHDGDGSNISAGISGIAGSKGVVGVVADLMLHSIAGRAGKNHLPGSPGVVAAPKSGISGIDDLRVRRVEGEGFNNAAEIEHMPGLAIILRNVTAGHIAVLNHQPRIVRTDRRTDRGASAAGAHDLPTVRTHALSKAGHRSKEQQNSKT